jgi:hypothetical protein
VAAHASRSRLAVGWQQVADDLARGGEAVVDQQAGLEQVTALDGEPGGGQPLDDVCIWRAFWVRTETSSNMAAPRANFERRPVWK